MKLIELLKKQLLEIATLTGLMILILTIYLQANSLDTTNINTIWGLILLSSTIVFRAESQINFHNLTDRLMSINYLTSSVLSDLTLLILLYYFTPGGKYFEGKAPLMLIIYVVCKTLFYLTAYFKNYHTSKKINKKLKQLNSQTV